MRNGEITKLRERLGFDRHEFAKFLGLTSYQGMMNIENGVRNPNRLAMKVLLYIASLSKKDALAFVEELNRHEPK